MKRYQKEQDQINHMKVYIKFTNCQYSTYARGLPTCEHSTEFSQNMFSAMCFRIILLVLAMAVQNWQDKLKAKKRHWQRWWKKVFHIKAFIV